MEQGFEGIDICIGNIADVGARRTRAPDNFTPDVGILVIGAGTALIAFKAS